MSDEIDWDFFASEVIKFLDELTADVDLELAYKNTNYIQKRLPYDIEQESINLMNRGWFIWFADGTISDFSRHARALVGKDAPKQDLYLSNYIKENISYFESVLTRLHPNRKDQIVDAFKCHSLKLYYASVPVFLILAEGIGRDFYPEVGIYAKHSPKDSKKGLPLTIDILDSVSSLKIFEEAILKPLGVSGSLTKSIHNPTDTQKELFNRHLIVHGHSNMYGSEENSLKAISLVFYMHKSLSLLKNKIPHD